MELFSAIVGKELEVPMWFGTTTGLTLATLDTVQAIDGIEIVDLEDDLSGYLTEISGVPGYYLLKFIPRRAGALHIQLEEGSDTYEFVVQSSLSVPPMVADSSLEGDYVFTVQVGSALVSNATVRVYDSTGAFLVARGQTDSQGEVVFALEAGQYQVRTSKTGYDFGTINPTVITVLPNDNVVPRLDEIIPPSASIGDTVALYGQFFDTEDSEVLFGAAAAQPALFTNVTGRIVMLELPTGITDLAIPVRVRKPDPDNPGSYLLSNVVTLTRIP